MSIVIENTYCSPKFINLKRSLFWQTYVVYKCVVGFCLCALLSISSFAQSVSVSVKSEHLLATSLIANTGLSDHTVEITALANTSGTEGRIYTEGEKFFLKNTIPALESETPKGYAAEKAFACSNVTNGGTINTSSGQTFQIYCTTSADPSTFLNSATPSGGNTNYIIYQWQRSIDNYTWTDISGATSSTYNPGSITTLTYYRRLARRNECTTWVSSNVIFIAVNMLPTVTLSKTDPTCGGSNGTITATGSGGILGLGSITYQYWTGISGSTVANLTSNANYPNNPTYTTALTSMEAPTDIADNFGSRMIGYLTPTITGTYYFWIASDDGSELWLSTTESASNKTRIAYHTSYTGEREWNKFSTQKSVGINLVAGEIYYIEAIHKEGGGGDNLAVGWAKPGESTTSPSEVIPIDAIRPYATSSVTTATYQYMLNNSGTWVTSNVFTGLAAGTHTVTIKDIAGCSTSTTITLNSSTPSVTADSNEPICAGQTLNLTGSASPTPSTYKWTGPGSFTSTSQNPSRTSATTAMSGIYTLAVTFSGCTATVTATTSVTVSTVPSTPSATGATRCGTGTVTLSASGCSGTYRWYNVSSGGSSLGTGSSFTTPSISNTTTYYVECNIGSCTSGRASAIATVNASPSPTATGDTECEGSTIILGSTGGTSYSWTGPNSFTSNLQNPSIPNGTTNMSGIYTVTVANSSGCTATATANVLVTAIPAAPTGSDVVRCGTGTVTLTATGCSGTYTWYANATTSTNLGTGASYTTPSISSTTTYYVSCTLNNCVSDTRGSIDAVVTSPPSAPTVVNGSRCGTGTVVLSASGCSGTYAWYTAATGGSSVGSGSSFTTPGISATTSYYVECNFGCLSSRAAAIATVNANPTAIATGDTECEGSTVVLASSGGTSYNWTGPNSFASTIQNPTISNGTLGMSGVYTVTVTNAAGCTATATASVLVKPIPGAPSGTDIARCGTGTVTLTATGCSGTYTWYANATSSTSLATGATYTTPSISSTTTYYVSCTLNGCVSDTRGSMDAIVTTPPAAPGTIGGSRCGTGTVTLSASGCAGTYAWYAAATGGSSLGSGTTFTTPSISSTTTYYVECNYGCVSTRATAVATINALPAITTTGDNECQGSTIVLGATGGTSYSWTGPNGFTSNLQNPTIANGTTAMSGVYTVTVTNASGCTATATASLLVKPIPAAPTGNDNSRCGSGTVTLSASGCTGGTYTWYANATTSTVSGAGSSFTTPSLSTTTTYYVSCTVNGCTSLTRGSADAIIKPVPAAPTTSPVSRCGTGSVTLSADNCAGTVTWYANSTTSTVLGTGNYTTPSLASGSTTTYYATCTVNSCVSTNRASLTVTVLIPPTASASSTGTHCMGTTFKLIGGGNGESFSWSGPNGFSSSEQSPLVTSATSAMSGVYTLTVTGSNGCTATATTNMVINSSCASICTTPVAVTPTNPTSCSGTDGYIFVTEYGAGPYYESSMDGITWYNSEKTYSGLGVGYYTIFIRDKTSKIVCRTISAVLISSTSSYFTGATTTSATSCSATDGKIVLQNVLGTDDVSWISSTSRNYVKVSSLSPANTISNLSQGTYYVVVSRGGNPLCYSERKVTVGNSGAACPPGLCTTTKSSNLFPGGDFGSGSSQNGPSLAPGETQYSYAPIASDSPNDGNYAIANSTDYNGATTGGNIFTTWDILTQDHTTGDVNGYMMIVNASFNPDIVIERTVTNLCPNTRYEYSLWIYNICPAANTSGCTIKPNLTFLVDGVGKYSTGDITGTGWQKVGFTFTTGNATTSIFSVRNNATGGMGNDWVIDDIAITQCLPSITQSANMTKCIGTTGQTVSATVTDGNTQYTYYKWQQSTDGGTTWSDLTSGAAATFSSGSYTVSYALPTITAAMNGRKYKIVVGTSLANLANSDCSFDGNETTLTVPTITVTPSANQNICNGSSATITASASGGSSPYTYSWSNSLGTGASKTVSPTTTTVYTVTVTDVNGCTATATTQVTVNSLPPAPTAVNASKCGAGTVTLGTTGCSGTVTWYASLTATSSLATGSNYTTPSISTTTSYYVTCTVNGCVSASRTTVTATINPVPTASATGDVICEGSIINLSANGGSTYNWVGPGGFSSNSQNPTIANAAIGMSGIYTVSISTTQGCSATATASVTVNPAPTPAISGNTSICIGQSTTLTVSGGDSYLWSTGQTTASINVNPATTTTYTVTAYATNSSYTNLVKNLSIFNAANFSYINSSASYAGPQNLFDGIDNTGVDTYHATRITNGQTWGIGYALGGDYLITSLSLDGRNDCCTERAKGGVMQIWKNGSMVYQSSVVTGTGNGVISATPAPNVIGDEIRYVFLAGANTASGETTLNFAEWIVGGSKVCSATTQVTVNVNTLPSPTANSNSPICSGKTLNLTGSGGISYQWAGPNGFSSGTQNPTITNVATPANSGTYTVTVTNANGCSATATTSVTINAIPEITIGSNSPVCSGQTLSFTASGGTSYQWSGPNNFSSTSQNPSIANVNSIHSGTYTVTVSNVSGCTSTSTIVINQPPVLTTSITKVDVSCNGGNNGSATVTPVGGTSPYTYQWSPSGGTGATASNLTAGTYTVTVTDAKGCTA
ncbi:PA14 domain-containing protein, partial [Emticicia sp. C21]|uniref:Ig-like domain-containing protein n=1 Tax=Emticicia sp. C21 TaxID=2302915 RepID=UPI000E97CAA3